MQDQWQVRTRFPNGDELSTVLLPKPYTDRWESCMFYANGDSNVVGSYDTAEQAIRAHSFLVTHELMHDVVKRQHQIG